MAVTAKLFGKLFLSAFNKEIDIDSDVVKCALFTNAHAPDQDADRYYDAVHGMTEVANGDGYTTGGKTVTTPTITYTDSTNVFKFDCDDIQWTAATITARYAVFYDSTPATNKPLIGYIDFGADVSCTNSTFDIVIAAGGVFTVTVS